jgi:23S rRNA pseudouridine1911/1915/1917 synthase
MKVNKSAAQEIIRQGLVTCDGRVMNQSFRRLEIDEELEIHTPVPPVETEEKRGRRSAGRASRNRFEVLYEDELLVVVNKPAGLLTVPTPHGESNTLQSQLKKYLTRTQQGMMAVCVHRLDRLVSGVLVFAKNFEVADELRSQFAVRKPQRIYTALVNGCPKPPQGTIRSYLSTDKQLNRQSSIDPQSGELAITHYRLREQWGNVSWLDVNLETGRRNQIRVHLAELGCPILGDPRYHPAQSSHRLWPHKRIALHAETLGLNHPATGQLMRFVSPWPQEFRDLRRQLSRKSTDR